MKQVKFILPLLLLVASIGNVWGAEYSYKTFAVSFNKGTTNGTNISGQVSNTTKVSTITSSGSNNLATNVTAASNVYYNASGAGIRISKKDGAGSIQFTLNDALKDSTIYAIVVYASKVSGNTKAVLDVTPAGGYTTKTSYANGNLSAYSTSKSANSNYKLDTIKVEGKKLTTLTFASVSQGYTHLHGFDIITQTAKSAPAPSTYTLHFDVQGHGTAPTDQTNISAGGKGTEPTAPTCTGYTFGGWYENSECSGSQWNFSTGTISANKTLYAKWTAKTYTITLDANGHGASNGSATATYDATTLSSVSGVTANTGYALNGYFTATSGGTKVINADGTLASNVSGYTDATGKWNKDDACTLYAQYTQSFTITFIDKLQNTTGYTTDAPHTINVNDGATFEFPAALTDKVVTADEKASGTCEQQHYHFVGWILSTEESTANNTGHANVKAAGSTSGAVSAAATYYAVWAKEE